MSYLSTLIPDCPNLQESLFDVFVSCNGNGRFREKLPFLTFLTSEANASRLSQRIVSDNAKIKTIELIYDQRLGLDSIERNVENPKCDATGKKGQCVTTCTVDPDENISLGCLIEAKDLRRNCQSNASYVQEQILDLVDALDRQASKDVAAKAVASLGNWASDVLNQDETAVANPFLVVSTKVAGSNDQLSAFTYQTITTGAEQTGYCDQKVVFAGIKLWNYFQASAFAGCCSQFGSDLNAAWSAFGIATMYDRDIVEAFGGDNAKAMLTQPGALQLITYTQAGWTDGMPGEFHGHNYYHTTITSPKTGLPYDLIVKDDCGKININVIGTFDLKAMPDDLAPVGDIYEGVNYVNGIEVVNV